MNKNLSKLILSCVLSCPLIANADSVDDRYVYIGTELGISDPVVKAFEHKDTKMRMELGRSTMIGGRVGYSFYPQMMVEVSGTHQPKYDVKYKLPAKPQFMIPELRGKTHVVSNVYTLNLIYELNKVKLGFKPYFIFGGGLAQMNIKASSPPSFDHPLLGSAQVFRVKKTRSNCLAWQAGAGLSYDITKNFAIDLSAKFQVVHDIKIKYDSLDVTTMKFVAQKPIKQSVALGEYVLGFTYKFPLSKN